MVDRDNLSAKFWLDPIQLARSLGFPAKDLRLIERMIVEHQQELQEKWNGYFIINRDLSPVSLQLTSQGKGD